MEDWRTGTAVKHTGERVTRCVQAKSIARMALTQSQPNDKQCLCT